MYGSHLQTESAAVGASPPGESHGGLTWKVERDLLSDIADGMMVLSLQYKFRGSCHAFPESR